MDFRKDTRAVSEIIGAILLLALLVILITLYQVQIVPAQNEQTEYSHSKVIQNDMLDLRNSILSADSSGERTYTTVKLGTEYQNRIIALNPPPAAGTLRTSSPQPISVEQSDGSPIQNLCPTADPIQTRTLQYTPGYHEYKNAPTIVYENSVLYLEYNGETVTLSGQNLVRGDTVNINPLNTSLSLNGVQKESVEPVPGNIRERDVSDAEITLPTGLSETTWVNLLEGQMDPADISVTDGELTLSTNGEIAVACSPLGLNEAPPGGAREAAGVSINPAGPNDVEVRRFNRPQGSNNEVEVTFNNTGNTDANLTEARLSFYSNSVDTGGDIGPINLVDQNGNTVQKMELLGSMEPVEPEIRLPGNYTETTLTFENTGGEKMGQRDFFVVKFTFSNGREGTYFIDVSA